MDSDKKTTILLQKLPQLQNFIKRDPQSYREEFLQQWQHFENNMAIFEQAPSEEQLEINDLIKFLSHVVGCYPDIAGSFPQLLKGMLEEHYSILNVELRRTMVSALILLKNKGLLESMDLLPLFFRLFRCQDKTLRENLCSFIVHDIKGSNAKHFNNKLNKSLQNFMYSMLKDSHEIAARKSLDVIIELYKRGIWCDERTVNIIAESCFSESPRMVVRSLNFFLEMSKVNSNETVIDSDDESNVPTEQDMMKLKHTTLINRKTKARKALLRKQSALAKRASRSEKSEKVYHFSALQLIHDPQGFVERLFSRVKAATASKQLQFETRVLMLNLISLLVGMHQLFLLNFYSYIIPYLQPHQKEVTTMLAITAQACHPLVPPNEVEPLIKNIADKFIWSNGASEVVVAGFNAIRLICEKCPLAMSADLLQSLLLDGKSYKQKGKFFLFAVRCLVAMIHSLLLQFLQASSPALAMRLERDCQLRRNPYHITIFFSILNLYALYFLFYQSHVSLTFQLLYLDKAVGMAVKGLQNLYQKVNPELLARKDRGKEATMKLSAGKVKPLTYGEAADSGFFNEDVQEEFQSEVETEEASGEESFDGESASDGDESDVDDEVEDIAPKEAEVTATQSKEASDSSEDSDDEEARDYIDPSSLLKGVKFSKHDKESRLATVMAGREDRMRFGSKKGLQKKLEKGSSLTNYEKSKKNKAFMMIVKKKGVVGKKKRSLRERQRVMKAHVKRQKMKKK